MRIAASRLGLSTGWRREEEAVCQAHALRAHRACWGGEAVQGLARRLSNAKACDRSRLR
jgi:hypothetical protein